MAYTVKGLAEKWDCSPKHVYNLISSGRLRTFSIGTRRGTRISDKEVEAAQAYVSQFGFPPCPSRHRRTRTRTYVYFAVCGAFVKVGFTKERPIVRVANMQVGNPEPIALYGYILGTRQAERDAHALLSRFHHRREWFHRTDEAWALIASFVNERRGTIYKKPRHAN